MLKVKSYILLMRKLFGRFLMYELLTKINTQGMIVGIRPLRNDCMSLVPDGRTRWTEMRMMLHGGLREAAERLQERLDKGDRVVIPAFSMDRADVISAAEREIGKKGGDANAVWPGQKLIVRRQEVKLTRDEVIVARGRRRTSEQELPECVERIRLFADYLGDRSPESMISALDGKNILTPHCSHWAAIVDGTEVVAVNSGATRRMRVGGEQQTLAFFAYANVLPGLLRSGIEDANLALLFAISFWNSQYVREGRNMAPSLVVTECEGYQEVKTRNRTMFSVVHDVNYHQADLYELYYEGGPKKGVRLNPARGETDISKLTLLEFAIMQIRGGSIITDDIPASRMRAWGGAIGKYYDYTRDAYRDYMASMFNGVPSSGSAKWVHDPAQMAYNLVANPSLRN